MATSPLSDSPYEVLGVSADADATALRAAYRRALRQAHPDTGGDPAAFHAVQRAWELVGTPEARAAFDRGRGGASGPAREAWAPAAPRPRRDSRPQARAYGHPGGFSRERYLVLIREWAGRGVDLDDPYDPALVRSAPRELRHILADAIAEEATARALPALGIAYTIWHDLATDAAGGGLPPKLDHLVLGPSGLFAVQSEDWGGEVSLHRGEIAGEALDGERPIRALAARAKAIGRAARVKPTALMVVVPDEHLAEPMQVGGTVRGAVVALVRRSRLVSAVREGLPGSAHLGGTEVMEVRSRLQASVRFAE
ncbi:DnaJ domain-containing protein [Agromyces aerolatus]|uniref:DnaJ domain-containing protein n=1 Tax=Agromyces sp. LY-1074 TaxID=3074080 RepID=UPI002865E686|nr:MULTISPECIES: DnaJ domain-containing protein [unclassified Agromyces]MDR5698780.1 DnaJ domain-containing protein [Agromyces sp. LY-1074]MDR5705442.1 DnaJ domain-containing protein [Agromyces sp. LY-1358]